jgi:hypothetical protein
MSALLGCPAVWLNGLSDLRLTFNTIDASLTVQTMVDRLSSVYPAVGSKGTEDDTRRPESIVTAEADLRIRVRNTCRSASTSRFDSTSPD